MKKSTRWLPLLAVAAAVLVLVPSVLAQPAPGTTLYALLGANRFPGGANTALGTLTFLSDTQVTLDVKVTGTDLRAWTPRLYSQGNCSLVLNWVGTRGTDGLPLHQVMTNGSEAPQALFGADVARIHAALERGERLALMLAGAGSGGATNQSPYRTCTSLGTTPPATTSTTTSSATATSAVTTATTTTRTTATTTATATTSIATTSIATTSSATTTPPVGSPPRVRPLVAVATPEDTPLPITLAATDPDGDAATFAILAGPTHGSLGALSSPVCPAAVPRTCTVSVSYTPDPDYTGPDQFAYAASDPTSTSNPGFVLIRVTPVNDAPVAASDSYTTAEDTALTLPAPGVLASDTDVDGDPLAAMLVAGPANGTLTLNPDGSFTYTPNANFNGTDSFTYRASDGSLFSNIATVTLTITPVNDAPVAVANSYTTAQDTPLTVPAPGVLGNDTDVEGSPPLTAVLGTGPANGILSLNADGSFSYTPSANFNGTDSFNYRASDGTALSNVAMVSITVVAPQADLSIIKDDGVTAVVPGTNTTYTITVTNNGPSTVTGATVSDLVPAGSTFVSATNGATYNAGTNTVHFTTGTLAPGGSTSFQVTLSVGPALTGSLSNTATVSPPAGTTDPDSTDNSATDTDTLTPQADLAITNDNGVSTVVPGTSTTYTIVVANAGPSSATSVVVFDPLPAGVMSATWSGNGHSNVAGAISDTIASLARGASVTYTLTVQVDPSARGSLANTATVSPPAGVTDPTGGNNSASDSDTLTPQVDLSVTIDDGLTTVPPNTAATWTIVLSNAGPSTATAIQYGQVKLQIAFASSACCSSSPAPPPASLAPGEHATRTMSIGAPTSSLTASIGPVSAAEPDINLANNSATDTTDIAAP